MSEPIAYGDRYIMVDDQPVWLEWDPLTVADCLEVPEVRALVEAASSGEIEHGCWRELAGGNDVECPLCKALAPFLAAMAVEAAERWER